MTIIDAAELRERLDELLERAGRGERIVVLRGAEPAVTLGPEPANDPSWVPAPRRRHRSDRTIADVLAEDRGA